MKISDYLGPDAIVFSEASDKDSVIKELVAKAAQLDLVHSEQDFLSAVLERESIMSTGIGLGVAVPHAKMAGIPNFLIVAGILSKPVAWDAIDRSPVSVVFLIGGPANRQNDYLKILSKITLVVKNPQRREALAKSEGVEAVLKEFEDL